MRNSDVLLVGDAMGALPNLLFRVPRRQPDNSEAGLEAKRKADERRARRADQRLWDQLVGFCRQHGGPCYRGWPACVLRRYLQWHVRERTLVLVQTSDGPDGKIVGCAIIYPCDFGRLTTEGKGWAFGWEKPNWDLPAVYFADFIAVRPGAMEAICQSFWERFPEGREKEWYCHRKGKLVRIDGSRIERRFLSGAGRALKKG